jgi:hypothetical protein
MLRVVPRRASALAARVWDIGQAVHRNGQHQLEEGRRAELERGSRPPEGRSLKVGLPDLFACRRIQEVHVVVCISKSLPVP